MVMGHAALSDLERHEHRFSEVLYREVPLLAGFAKHPDPLLVWSLGPPGTDSHWKLKWNGAGFDVSMADHSQGFSLNLETQPVKPLVLQGPGGLSQKSPDGSISSLYYSFTRLETRGQLEINGETVAVTGSSWFDKEFGEGALGKDQAGWDWLSLQLEDGQEVMLYRLRGKDDSQSFAHGTLVTAKGKVRYLGASAWQLTSSGTWTSPENHTRYPQVWHLVIPGEELDLRIVPIFPDQENRSRSVPGLAYWEGAARILGSGEKNLGRGYVELTGYGETRRPVP
jgi:predicted secreted hydrolase